MKNLILAVIVSSGFILLGSLCQCTDSTAKEQPSTQTPNKTKSLVAEPSATNGAPAETEMSRTHIFKMAHLSDLILMGLVQEQDSLRLRNDTVGLNRWYPRYRTALATASSFDSLMYSVVEAEAGGGGPAKCRLPCPCPVPVVADPSPIDSNGCCCAFYSRSTTLDANVRVIFVDTLSQVQIKCFDAQNKPIGLSNRKRFDPRSKFKYYEMTEKNPAAPARLEITMTPKSGGPAEMIKVRVKDSAPVQAIQNKKATNLPEKVKK